MPTDDMEGPGGARCFAARWTICADLVADTAVHLGSGEDGQFVDLALVRHRVSGRPLLTGSSLAGGLRDHLCDRLLSDRQAEPVRARKNGERPNDGKDKKTAPLPPDRVIADLFGAPAGDREGGQSALIAFDAVGGQAVAEVRDGVTIDPKLGTAREHFKYDLELWPAGTTFGLRLDVLIDEGPANREAALLAGLALAFEGFDAGAIRLGARGRRGLGRCHLQNLRARRFALDSPRGWKAWLSTWQDEPRPDTDIPGAPPVVWPPGSIAAEYERLRHLSVWRELALAIPVHFTGGTLIRAPGASGDASPTAQRGADMRHLRSGGTPILSGTSVAGALRHRGLRIARFVRSEQEDADAWVEELFGTPPREQDQPEGRLQASRLTVEEVPLTGGCDLQVTRIKLNRFTQAPVEGHLLQEEPRYRPDATLRLRLRLPHDDGEAEALSGLLLLIVKDLLLGDIPLGGTTGIGRGVLRPAGPVTIHRTGSAWIFSEGEPPAEPVRAAVEGWVRTFASHPRRSARVPAGR